MSTINTPQSGVGIVLSQSTTSGGTYTAVAELRDDCEFEGYDTAVIPIKTLVSGSVAKVPGRTDFGGFNGSVWLTPGDTNVAALITLAAAKTSVYWKLTLVDGTPSTGTGSIFAFYGFISNLKPGNFTGEDAPTMDFSIAISGAVSFTAPT